MLQLYGILKSDFHKLTYKAFLGRDDCVCLYVCVSLFSICLFDSASARVCISICLCDGIGYQRAEIIV